MNKAQKQRLLWLLLSLLAIITAIVLILYALRLNINLYVTPNTLTKDMLQQDVKLGGMVLPNSVQYNNNDDLSLTFILVEPIKQGATNDGALTDGALTNSLSNQYVKVYYTGLLPDLFKEGSDIIAVGRVATNTDNDALTFQATQVLAKHDENYSPVTK